MMIEPRAPRSKGVQTLRSVLAEGRLQAPLARRVLAADVGVVTQRGLSGD